MTYVDGTKVFCVSYDLKAPGRNYEPLYQALKQSALWWHYLESTWLIKSRENPAQIWARLSPTIDKNDFLLIIEVRNNAQGWLPKEAWEWINANVPS